MSKTRKAAVWSLVALATLLLLVSSTTVWTKRQLLDTDAWTKASGQLLVNDEVRGVLSTTLVDLLYQRVDVPAQLKARLPQELKAAAPVAAAALRSAGTHAVDAFLGSAAAQALWETANRHMHSKLVALLEGKKVTHVSTEGGNATLDLRPLLKKVAERLGVEDKLKAKVSPTTGVIVILRADQLESAQTAVQVIRVLTIFLLLGVLALYAAAIFLARDRRRRTLEMIGGSVFLTGMLLLTGERVIGHAIVESVVKIDANRPAGHAAWLIATTILRDMGVALVVYGLIAVAAALLAGPSRVARTTRRWLAPVFRRHVSAVYAVAVAIFLILIAWGPFTSNRSLIGILILLALLLLGLEIWRRQTLREFPETPVEAKPG